LTAAVGTTALDWTTGNQRYLVAAIHRVREALERHVAAARASTGLDLPAEPVPDGPSGTPPMATAPALDILSDAFGLSTFERDILVLCAAVELDGSFARLCALAQGDESAIYPTFGLGLAALPDAHWSAIAPAGPLRRWRLVDLESGRGVTSGPLRIEERVLHFLTGLELLDERLEALIEPLESFEELSPSQQAVADGIIRYWSVSAAGSDASPGVPTIQVCGPDSTATRAVAAHVFNRFGLRAFVMQSVALPSSPQDLDALLQLWARDAVLGRAALALDCHDADPSEAGREALGRFVRKTTVPTIMIGRDPVRQTSRVAVVFDVDRPRPDERRIRWKAELGQSLPWMDETLDRLVGQFELGTEQIRAAAAQFQADAPADSQRADRTLWDACRRQARPHLDDLGQRIDPAATWDDLVLPEAQHSALRAMAVHSRQRATVYDAWGFGSKGLRGLGISALFAGASGTGKTMAAEVLAGELRLDLYRIDLSSIVSKYIGETEKNLRRVFDAAESGGAILLFDEADALFGKRSEVKDSHDRYANIEVSYLLQRMEAYRGLAILTTNLKSALDPAFLRRIRFVVPFPFPGPAERAEIWRRIFPASTPTEGLRLDTLARLNVAGGSIRNIALGAAFLAADAGEPVRMAHILRAARTEYTKLEKPLTSAEVGDWHALPLAGGHRQ
jgi:hypothetical protein